MQQPQLDDSPLYQNKPVCTGMNILHVDDRTPFLELTSEYLTQELDDITVITRTDPRSAVSYLETNDIDCIVSDYAMGTMDGLEFYEQAKSQAPNVPFILFTIEEPDRIASDALKTGIDSYLQKSSTAANFSILANRISMLVELYEK